MYRFKISFIVLFFGSAILLSTGCDSEKKGSYDVDVFWQIGGADTCQAVDSSGDIMEFDDVVVSVYSSEKSEETIRVESISCTKFGHTISDLKRGTYWVVIEAMTDYDGETLPYYQSGQSIKAPSAAEHADGYKFPLEKGTATIKISWNFENYYWCDENGVVDMDISIANELVSCEDENYVIEEMSGGKYSISIDGLDADGDVTMSGVYNEGELFDIVPGKNYDLLVILSD